MSNEEHKIPRHGGAGVVFLGVELGDALILIVSVFLCLPAGRYFGSAGYIGMPVAGFFLNQLYVDWRSKTLPGSFKAKLFSLGFSRYSNAFTEQNVVYIGDANIINPATKKIVNEMIESNPEKTN